MPSLGEFTIGKDIGSSQKTSRFIWVACIDCGKQRWVRYKVRQSKPTSVRCLSCIHKLIQSEIREGVRPKRTYTEEQRTHLSNSKKGVKNPNWRKYGELNPAWKGGRRNLDGYIRIWVHPADFFYPMADSTGTVAEHRLVVAKSIGRCLLPWEVVHHKNGVRHDNRIGNLELISDRHYHMVDTVTQSYIKRLEDKIKKLGGHQGSAMS